MDKQLSVLNYLQTCRVLVSHHSCQRYKHSSGLSSGNWRGIERLMGDSVTDFAIGWQRKHFWGLQTSTGIAILHSFTTLLENSLHGLTIFTPMARLLNLVGNLTMHMYTYVCTHPRTHVQLSSHIHTHRAVATLVEPFGWLHTWRNITVSRLTNYRPSCFTLDSRLGILIGSTSNMVIQRYHEGAPCLYHPSVLYLPKESSMLSLKNHLNFQILHFCLVQ